MLDVALSPPGVGETPPDRAMFSGAVLDSLELVIPPWVASSLLSPLLLLESVVVAFAGTGADIALPGLLLLMLAVWGERRRRRERDEISLPEAAP